MSKALKGRGARRVRYGQRIVGNVPPRRIVAIVCDDSKTAVAYFDELKRRVREMVTITVVRAPRHGAAPDAVIDRAREVLKSLVEGTDGHDDDQQSVWALIDMEHSESTRAQARLAKEKGGRHDIGVALSNPCFEVWTLLHLEDTGKHFESCGAVVAAIKPKWRELFGQPFEQKAQADYGKLIGRIEDARTRARQHRDRDDPSWTEVYLVVEDILRAT